MDLELDMDVDLPPEIDLTLALMDIKALDGSRCKKCIISSSATYVWLTCEKVTKKKEFTAENGTDQ